MFESIYDEMERDFNFEAERPVEVKRLNAKKIFTHNYGGQPALTIGRLTIRNEWVNCHWGNYFTNPFLSWVRDYYTDELLWNTGGLVLFGFTFWWDAFDF